MRRQRPGWTMVEALVVIGIVSVLGTLLLVAVQSSRHAAWRVQCTANMRQIGLALHAYAADHRVFPGIILPSRTKEGGAVSSRAHSAFGRMLPYLDHQELYQTINFSTKYAGVLIPDRPGGILNRENATAAIRTINAFLCPADGARNGAGGNVNYRFSLGSHSSGWSHRAGELGGAFAVFEALSAADFADGLAHTAGASERLIGSGRGRPIRVRDFAVASRGKSDFPPEAMRAHCTALSLPDEEPYLYSGFSWLMCGNEQTTYNHVNSPNASGADCTVHAHPPNYYGSFPPRSLHRGGVNVMMMDGSVQFIGDGVADSVWRALGTRSGRDNTGA